VSQPLLLRDLESLETYKRLNNCAVNDAVRARSNNDVLEQAIAVMALGCATVHKHS